MRQLQGWADIDVRDIAVAYHKAKCDAFFERSTVVAAEFSEYEDGLEANLLALLGRIHAGDAPQMLDEGSRGYEVLPKKLAWQASADSRVPRQASADSPAAPSWVRSSPEQRFDRLVSDHSPTLELRLCARFTVEAHIIGALWINLVGHRLDAALGECCYGSRLRRLRSQTEAGAPRRSYHVEARGSFEPYFHPYRRWRADAMRRIRTELRDDQRVLVLMLDLRSYYHNVDPTFVGLDDFMSEVEQGLGDDERLTPFERDFTNAVAASFAHWGAAARAAFGVEPHSHWGIPIGSAVARVFANILLLRWDRAVREGLTPLFYGRYVDDMILVLRDPGTLHSAENLEAFLSARIATAAHANLLVVRDGKQEWEIALGEAYAATSKLTIHSNKLRVFSLEGESGLDFLATLDHEAREVSSERRLLPDPDLLDRSFAARLLTAAELPGDDADTFRRAGMLSVRRFAWSVNLYKAEVLSIDLPPDAWRDQRHEFYRFARTHVLCADKLLNHADTLGRLIALAVACGDWVQARMLLSQTVRAVDRLRLLMEQPGEATHPGDGLRLNGAPLSRIPTPTEGGPQPPANSARHLAWSSLRAYIGRAARQALARAWTSAPPGDDRDGTGDAANSICAQIGQLIGLPVAVDETRALALRLFRADLARTPIAEHLCPSLDRPETPQPWFDVPVLRTSSAFLLDAFGGARNRHRHEWIAGFIDTLRRSGWGLPELVVQGTGRSDLTPFFFSTRPVSASAIAYSIPETTAEAPTWALFDPPRPLPDWWQALSPTSLWAHLLRALRGVATADDTPRGPTEGSPPVVELPYRPRFPNPRLALANIRIEDAWWEGAAAGRPVLSVQRYQQLATLVNEALKVRPSPEYLVLPELSLPRRWTRSTARFVNAAGMSLIAGVEYGHGPARLGSSASITGQVTNQAIISVIDDRLGFPYVTELWQTKTRPAPHEGEALHRVFGRSWNGGIGAAGHPRDRKPVYDHRGLCFGVLVCSELRNANYRVAFQGNVDLLLVISWNQDLLGFEPLVESAALDIHAYVGLVNNARFGDTRLRLPAKDHFRRDVCRVRGGLNDYIVLAELRIDDLRTFHSRHLDWPTADDPFKPVPEGFVVSALRRTVPRST